MEELEPIKRLKKKLIAVEIELTKEQKERLYKDLVQAINSEKPD